MTPRYYVRKGPEGYLTAGRGTLGCTFAVLDRLACHRVVAAFSTTDRVIEHYKPSDWRHQFRYLGHEAAQRLARAACRRLNAWDQAQDEAAA